MSRSAAVAPAFPADATHVLVRRAVAHTVDGIVLAVIFIALLIPALLLSEALGSIVLLLWFTVGPVAYFVIVQRRDGRSPGKRLVRIRVVDAEGRTPSSQALVRRSVPFVFEYLFAIALVVMICSRYRQRLGDRWGKTYVIEDEAARA